MSVRMVSLAGLLTAGLWFAGNAGAQTTPAPDATTAAAPVFSLAAGSYPTQQVLAISDATSGATIRYTTNGETPTAGSAVYAGPITVSATETVEAIATAPGLSESVAAVAAYTITGVARVGDIITVAGLGATGHVGNDGPALDADLTVLFSVALDSHGNVYASESTGISDEKPYVVEVDALSGNLIVIAGNGTRGFSGDGGPATQAQLSYSFGVAVDKSGNIYIADSDNCRIRKVDGLTKVITTVAGNGTAGETGDGGSALDAEIFPTGIAIDPSGNLLFVDNFSRVRKVNAVTGIITTIAGTGISGYSGDHGPATLAELNQPTGIASDEAGNIYIADSANNVIRKVSASTGIITTFAGSYQPGYFGDGGPAVNAELYYPNAVGTDSQGNVYIADTSNDRVRKVNVSTGIITTLAGNGDIGSGFLGDGLPATEALLGDPNGVAVSKAGVVYITDQVEQKIRAVLPSGIIQTVAGSGLTGYNGDGEAAVNAGLAFPQAVATDTDGNVYIADSTNARIRKITKATGGISTIAGNGSYGYTGNGLPQDLSDISNLSGIAVDRAGNVYFSDKASLILKVSAASGAVTIFAGNGLDGYSGDGGAATNAEIFVPNQIAVDAHGNLYFADSSDCVIRKVSAATGVITTVAGSGSYGYSGDGGPAVDAKLWYPQGVAVDAKGNLYIADTSNFVVRKVTASTGIITTVAGSGNYGYSGDGGPALSAALTYLQDVAVDSAGNLYIADTDNSVVRKVDTQGMITTLAGDGVAGSSGDGATAKRGELNYIYGLSVDPYGNLYIADYYNSRIREVVGSTTHP